MLRLDKSNLDRLFDPVTYGRTGALTGYAQGINPFNQPGVEAYKQEMFLRLGKPGTE